MTLSRICCTLLTSRPNQIAEARRLVCQTAKLLPDVLVDRLAARTRDRVLPCGGSAALALSERCQRVFEHIMDERAGLGRGKRRRAAHLRLEAILIKERARAGEELIHARSGQIELFAVQTLDGVRFRQRTARAALSCRREHPLVILIKGIGRRDRRCAVAREIRARKLDRRPLRLQTVAHGLGPMGRERHVRQQAAHRADQSSSAAFRRRSRRLRATRAAAPRTGTRAHGTAFPAP